MSRAGLRGLCSASPNADSGEVAISLHHIRSTRSRLFCRQVSDRSVHLSMIADVGALLLLHISACWRKASEVIPGSMSRKFAPGQSWRSKYIIVTTILHRRVARRGQINEAHQIVDAICAPRLRFKAIACGSFCVAAQICRRTGEPLRLAYLIPRLSDYRHRRHDKVYCAP